MFSKASKSTDKTAATGPRPASKHAMPSIISADLQVSGNLTSTGDIQVEGSVEGDIESRTVTIGEAAQIRGSVTAETVRICGTVTGQVKGANVALAKSARVTGDILHQSLAIEQGAFVDGHCRRTEAAPVQAKAMPMRDKGAAPTPETKPAAAMSGGPISGGLGRPLAGEAPAH